MTKSAEKASTLYCQNWTCAKRLWTLAESKGLLQILREVTTTFGFSVRLGELILLDGKWYVTHACLLVLARRNGSRGIRVQRLREFCDPAVNLWAFRATVYKSPPFKDFVDYGAADPSNASPLVRGDEMRVAETRAVNRALRKAYGFGLCSIEEIGALPLVSADQFQPAIWPVHLFSLSSIELGLPCGRSRAVPLASAFGSAPSRPSVPSERRGGFSVSSSPFACPNLTPSPGAKARNQLTLLSA